jgi:hypothetical protein
VVAAWLELIRTSIQIPAFDDDKHHATATVTKLAIFEEF